VGGKHGGEGIVEEIIRARNVKMPEDIFDFVDGLDVHQVNRQALEALIKAGALDCFPGNKAQKLAVIGDLIESAQNTAKNTLEGQISLFSMGDGAPNISIRRTMPYMSEFLKEDLLRMEKEMIGIYLSDHPLHDVEEKLKKIISVDTATLLDPERNDNIKNGDKVTMGGLITGVKKMITKKGDQMAFLTLEDLTGQIEVVVFPRTFEECRQHLEPDKIVVIRGRLDLKEEGNPKLMAESVSLLEDNTCMLKVVIPGGYTDAEGLEKFREIAKQHLGETPVAILVTDTGHKYRLEYNLWVDGSSGFYDKMYKTFGKECFR